MKPIIVCLCGSTRFSDAYRKANLDETLAGRIVLTIGCDMRSDTELFVDYTDQQLSEVKSKLDDLHLCKIDLADEILVLNVGMYIGDSTLKEINYARLHGKTVRFLEHVNCINCDRDYEEGTGQFTVFGKWFCNDCID